GELSAGNAPAKVGEPARSGCDLPALTKLREAENGKCRPITGLTRVFRCSLTLDSIGRRATISHRAHLCAGTHDHTKSDFPLRPPIMPGSAAIDWNTVDIKVDSTSGKPGCHSTQPAPNPSIEALDKALLLLFAARG